MENRVGHVLTALRVAKLSVTDFLCELLTNESLDNSPAKTDVLKNATTICRLLHDLGQSTSNAQLVTYNAEVKELAHIDNGLHFRAVNASANQIEGFHLPELAERMREIAPQLWHFLGCLLTGSAVDEDIRGNIQSQPEENDLDELEEIIQVVQETPEERQTRKERECTYLVKVKKTVILSIILQTVNRKANTLPSLIGVFLHSCKAPERSIEALAHMGLSVSVSTIHRMTNSLSIKSAEKLRESGQTRLVAYASDNFDVNLKPQMSTFEKHGDTLHHLTSALLFPLQHGVTSKDLKWSGYLWDKSPLNTKNLTTPSNEHAAWKTLSKELTDEPEVVEESHLTQQESFVMWKFLHDLFHFSEPYFETLIPMLDAPPSIDQIPLEKTPIIPARAMDLNNSTVAGNISAIEELIAQAGLGDPAESEDDVDDLGDYVIPWHGDLGTGDRIASALLRRSAESSAFRRLQSILFIPGLFHLRMACADAIWRLALQSPDLRIDLTSLMKDIFVLHPKQTGTFASTKVTFRLMHNLINNAGIVRRLDMWRIIIQEQHPHIQDLESFAKTEPTYESLKKLAISLAKKIVSESGFQLGRKRRAPGAQPERDQQLENSYLLMKYFLLYEELTYSMNVGDIGRLEKVLVSWIFIFKALGKHKYAFHMQKFLLDVHVRFPEPLRHAIRHNLLVNLTGKAGMFRAVDWVVELMNLYTKTIYGGDGSNYTIERIIKESPLITVYRTAHTVIERNFLSTKLTSRHTGPDMARTFKAALRGLEEHKVHERVPGRKSARCIVQAIEIGRGLMSEATLTGTDRCVVTEDSTGSDIDGGVVNELDILGELV